MTKQYSIITVHPRFVNTYRDFGVLRSAIEKFAATVSVVDLRDYAVDKHASVDAAPYGGGDGMVIRPEPLRDALAAMSIKPYVIYTSPSGKRWTQADVQRLATMDQPIAFVCGRFGGVDQRFIDQYVDEEFSLGDFVVSGGELPVLMMLDSIVRLLPGALGNEASSGSDSFASGMQGMLEYPLYTRPPEFEGHSVPEVLLSGDHEKIRRWRNEQSFERTKRLRPDLLKK